MNQTQHSMFEHDDAPSHAELDARLIDAYRVTGRTLDDLPYTPEFDALLAALPQPRPEAQAVLRRLYTLRKAGKLPRLGRAPTPAVKVGPDDEETLLRLVVERAGTLGQRDSLLYTPAFAQVVEDFNQRTGRQLSPHAAWRLLAKIAK